MKIRETVDLHYFKVTAEDLNHLGILFGGKLLAKLDSSLAGSVQKLTPARAVTGSVDKVRFIKALNIDDNVTIKSMVSGHTDRVVEVIGLVYNDQKELAAYAILSFVVIDKDVLLPKLVPETDFEKGLLEGYQSRMKLSSGLHEQIKSELGKQNERDI